MELPEDVVEDVRSRLRRIAGQVQGIERVWAEGRDCRDVVTPLTAVSKAGDSAGFKLVAGGLTYCPRIQKRPRPLGTRSLRSRRCSWTWREHVISTPGRAEGPYPAPHPADTLGGMLRVVGGRSVRDRVLAGPASIVSGGPTASRSDVSGRAGGQRETVRWLAS